MTAWQAIVARCAELTKQAEQQADDDLYDHVDPYF